MTENEIQKGCIELLVRSGWMVIRLNGGKTGHISWLRWWADPGMSFTKGISDIMAYNQDHKPLALEVKKPGGELSLEQKAFLVCAMRHGMTPLVVQSVEELEGWLEC